MLLEVTRAQRWLAGAQPHLAVAARIGGAVVFRGAMASSGAAAVAMSLGRWRRSRR
jgi:hypothetical protein